MHTLYKRKKTLLLVALFSINSLGSFMPAIKALPTKKVSSRYAPPPLSALPPRVAMIAKSKEEEYGRMLKYYEYRVSWNSFYKIICLYLLVLGPTIYLAREFIYNLGSGLISVNSISIEELLGIICFLASLCALIVAFLKAKYAGAILLTDTGILYIDCGYNTKYEFIPYADIKTVQFHIPGNHRFITIEFAENFSDYERKGIKYTDVVNSIAIRERSVSNKASGGNAFRNLYRSLLKITEKIHMAAMREKAKQESDQEKGKSLLQIKKEQKGFIDRLEDLPEELHTKTTAIQTDHPGIFTQIKAYYQNEVSPYLLMQCVVLGLVLIALLLVILYYDLLLLKEQYVIMLYMIVSGIYYIYDFSIHPTALLITDTGFLYIEAGKKLKYTFIRYEHIKELLRNVNKQRLLVRSTEYTDETTSGAMSRTLEIECAHMEKELFDALYENLRLKKAEVEAGKSRLAK